MAPRRDARDAVFVFGRPATLVGRVRAFSKTGVRLQK